MAQSHRGGEMRKKNERNFAFEKCETATNDGPRGPIQEFER